jgi:hypothetical protein
MNMLNFDDIESIYCPDSFMTYIENIVNNIEQSGFDVYEELDEFTINSILKEPIHESYDLVFSERTIESKMECGSEESTDFEDGKCNYKKCDNKSLRDNTCRMHLLLNKENKCIVEKCNNLKSRSNKKSKKYNDLCTRHLKYNRTKYAYI